MHHHLTRHHVFRSVLVVLALALLAAGCSQPASPATSGQPSDGSDQAQSSEATTAQATSTVAFRIELPVTATPTEEPTAAGQTGPTRTPVPTNTPRPTKTPWPTQAPTSAPVDDPNMVYVEGGEFVFGSDSTNEDESPQQTVYVDAFNIDKYPVTCAQYKEFVDATGHATPRNWKEGAIPEGAENTPVVWVTWHDATAYAEWAGKRLPTEIEWEKAARGTDGRAYPWGDTFDQAKCNSREGNLKATSPIDSYPDSASPYGAMDMSGNVWEWTSDWYDAYRGSVYAMERYGTTYKALRGGSWFDGQDAVRTTTRNSAKPEFMFSTIGFRCAQ